MCARSRAALLGTRLRGLGGCVPAGLELNPQYTQGRAWYALFWLQTMGGRHREAVAEARRTLDADPLSPYAMGILALVLGIAGQAPEALPHARLAARLEPDALISHWIHGQVAHWAGERDEAMAAFARACDVSNRSTYPLASQAAACAAWGLKAEARALYQELLAKRAQGFVACGPLAISAAAAGDMDAAAEFMEQSCDEREPVLMVYFREYPDWQPLRDHPRSAEVRRRLALPGDVRPSGDAGAPR